MNKKTNSSEQTIWGHCSVNCEGRCALRFIVKDDEVVRVETDNGGSDAYGEQQLRACQRGRSIRELINHPDRLKYPLKRTGRRGEGLFERISWDEAIETFASTYKRILSQYGPESVYLMYGTGVQASNIPPFLKRFANINGGYLRRYGDYSAGQISEALPYMYGSAQGNSYSDLINAELIVMFGENPVETHTGGAGSGYHLTHALQEGHGRLIVIDPRYSDTAATRGDQWVPIRPGTDGALAEAISYVLITNDLVDTEFINTYTLGYEAYVDHILGRGADKTAKTPAWAQKITGVNSHDIINLAHEIAHARTTAICQGKGPQRQSNGEQTARAICMLAIISGNVGIHGGNTGADLQSYYYSPFSIPVGTNPIKTAISFYTWLDGIDRGTQMTALKDGVRGKEKLDVPIKMLLNYAGNAITNQHGDINHTHEVLQDESKCEFIVVWDTFMTDSAKYADLLLPDLMACEQPNIVTSGIDRLGNMGVTIVGSAIPGKQYERRSLYSVLRDVSRAMGVEEAFTEGKTQQEWLEYRYKRAQKKDKTLPPFEQMQAQGIHRHLDPVGNRVALSDFRTDPLANPLDTPSGKIEIYSQRLADIAATWHLESGEVIDPLPIYTPGLEGYGDTLMDKYPLQLSAYHFKGRAHSSYGCIPVLADANRQLLWMNPLDAKGRRIENGDTVEVFNDRGRVEIEVYVTARIIPGAVSMPQGAWHTVKEGDKDRVDIGGCVNTLTSAHPSPLAKANPQHTNLVEVRKKQ